MKYMDLFTLNPIESVIEINDADNKKKAQNLISTFVVTQSLEKDLANIAIPQLDFTNNVEGKGIFVVGNYGTGKSHVMSFLSIIAEDEEYLQYVSNYNYREKLRSFAGKFKVRRLQIAGSKMNLYDIVAQELTLLAETLGFTFKFKPLTQVSNVKIEFQRFMETFDEFYPGIGVLFIIDELLHYLESRDDQDLIIDLSVLQALGEFSDDSRFVFMAGLQQALFNNPRFSHVANELGRVRRRFYDFVIDNEGISQLIEQYLFQKNNEQRKLIRKLLESKLPLYETLTTDIENFIDLFPAHPKFIEEFQKVFVVERREILTILSQEARALLDKEVDFNEPDLISSDDYWKYIVKDQGLQSNRDVAKVVKNISTIISSIKNNFAENEDIDAAIRLIYGLGVNRLTTYSINEQVGLTPSDLKNNLLWNTKIPFQDSKFLTMSAKRILDRIREAANGQFLTFSTSSGQYFIDPTKDVDYEQRVISFSKTINKNIVQRYLNEIFTRALEMNNTESILEGRLWEYTLMWSEKNVERPGWLFFGFPNQRSTANPPKDFYLFVIPSKRITGIEETWEQKEDEIYWFIDGFPEGKHEYSNELKNESEPDTFLDKLRKYAASRERALVSRGDEQHQYEQIAGRILKQILPEFNENAGEWISLEFNGQKKRFSQWVSELAPGSQTALLKTKVNAVSQAMMRAHFNEKYPNYPEFDNVIHEATRAHNAQAAIEIICSIGMTTKMGINILNALELYKDDTFTPEHSSWLNIVRDKLNSLNDGQVLNHSELFEKREGRVWMKNQSIEAEWLHIILAAGVEAGYLVIFGNNNTRFDATNLRDFYHRVKSYDQIIRIAKPIGTPIEKWRKIFGILGVNKGLLANQSTHGEAIIQFQSQLSKTILNLVDISKKLQVHLPLHYEKFDNQKIDERSKIIDHAKGILESLLPLNSRAKMTNLIMKNEELEYLDELLNKCKDLEKLFAFTESFQQQLAALERYENILQNDNDFMKILLNYKHSLNNAYSIPKQFSTDRRNVLVDEMKDTLNAAFQSYRTLHKKHSLDREGDLRKKRLLQSDKLRNLNKMANIKVLNKSALNEIHHRLSLLPIYQSCSDEDLLKSPTSLCPFTKFNPQDYVSSDPAQAILNECEEMLNRVYNDWTEQLLLELSEPAVLKTLMALKPEEKQIIDNFFETRSLPSTITEVFVTAINIALSGLKRRTITSSKFVKQVWGDGEGPLKTEELRQKFEKWLVEELGADQPETVRFVLEEF